MGPTHRWKFLPCPEYTRRNNQVSKVIGATAEVDVVMERLGNLHNVPKWLSRSMKEIKWRIKCLSPDLAAYRDSAPDYPYAPIGCHGPEEGHWL